MVRISVSVCDVCKDRDKPTEPIRVTIRGASSTFDLCAEDRAPILELFKKAGVKVPDEKTSATSRPAAKRTSRRGRGFTTAVRTMEEIEASKKG